MTPVRGAERFSVESIDLRGLVVVDAIGARNLDLGAEVGPTILVLIRHRF